MQSGKQRSNWSQGKGAPRARAQPSGAVMQTKSHSHRLYRKVTTGLRAAQQVEVLVCTESPKPRRSSRFSHVYSVYLPKHRSTNKAASTCHQCVLLCHSCIQSCLSLSSMCGTRACLQSSQMYNDIILTQQSGEPCLQTSVRLHTCFCRRKTDKYW